MALERPASGRIFSEQLIRDNIDIGRPDKVSVSSAARPPPRQAPHSRDLPDPVITTALTQPLCTARKPSKRVLKEGRALRTETTINQPPRLRPRQRAGEPGRLAEVGYAATGACSRPDPPDPPRPAQRSRRPGSAITTPVITSTCTRIPGLRFTDPRVQALLAACCTLALRPRLHQPHLRHYLAPRSGRPRGHDHRPDHLRPSQATRLPIIERIPHSQLGHVMPAAWNRLGHEGDASVKVRDYRAIRDLLSCISLTIGCPCPPRPAWPKGAVYQGDRTPGCFCCVFRGGPEFLGSLVDQRREEGDAPGDRGLCDVEYLGPDLLGNVIASVSHATTRPRGTLVLAAPVSFIPWFFEQFRYPIL